MEFPPVLIARPAARDRSLRTAGTAAHALVSLMILVVSAAAPRAAAQATGRTALPALGPMRSTHAPDAPLVVAGQLGVGYFEPRPDAASVVRLGGGLSLAYAPVAGLLVGVSFDGALDLREAGGARGVTGLGVPELEVRYVGGERLRVGGAIALALPGADAPSLVGAAVTPTFAGLLGVTLGGPGALEVEVAFRFDRSGQTVESVYSTVDRTTMGVSDASMMSLRVGYAHALASGVVYAAFAPSWLVGPDAPGFAESPSKLGLGFRSVGANAYEVAVEVSTSAVVDVQASPSALPVLPRVFVAFGGRLARLGEDARETDGEDEPTDGEPTDGDGSPMGPSDAAGAGPDANSTAAGEAPTASDLPSRPLRVVDATGAPVVDARVTAEGAVHFTDADGVVSLPGARGPMVVRIEAPGFAPVERTLAPGELADPVSLDAVTAHGTVRGEVRDLDGNAIPARVRVTCGRRGDAVDVTGEYAIDVAPGRCTVEATAPGYTTERRTVTLGDGEVTIVNFDLRRR